MNERLYESGICITFLLQYLKNKTMRKRRIVTTIVAIAMIGLVACEKSESLIDESLEGTYIGTLTNQVGLKGGSVVSKTEDDAIAEITKIGKGTIEVHIQNVELDTIFLLNYYKHMNNVEVCLTGDDFENMYGHMLGQGHMNGGMMGDLQNNETEWVHHLNDEHENDDEHFGGFDMEDHTFSYRLIMMEGGIPYDLQFQGMKK